MRLLLIIFLFASLRVFAQQTIDPGCLKANPAFCQNDDTSTDNICHSKHEIEIRLFIRELRNHRMDCSQVILTYDKSSWKATQYTFALKGECTPEASYFIDKLIPLKAVNGFDRLFEDLKANEIFSLPNQLEIFPDTAMNGGVAYDITFKVGQSFGYYFFFNPGDFMKISNRKEFVEYRNIVGIFREQLMPQ